MNGRHPFGLAGNVDLNIGARASQANDETILYGLALNALSGEVGAVGANVVNFPTVFALAQLDMVARDHGAVENDVVIYGATNTDDGLFFKRPALHWGFIDGVQQRERDDVS